MLDRDNGIDRKTVVRLGDELQEYLGAGYAASIQAVDLDSLRNSLKRDADLKGHVSEDVLKMIQELIDKKTKGFPVILDAENRWVHLAESGGQRQKSTD